MTIKGRILGIGIFTVLSGMTGTASAGDLVTNVAYVSPLQKSACKIVNVSTSSMTVDVQLWSAQFNSLINSSGATILNPGDYTAVVDASNQQVYCRFVGAKKTKVRASLHIFENGGDFRDNIVVPAS